MLMNSRGEPPFLGCMLMNSRGRSPILRGDPPLGTISMDQTVSNDIADDMQNEIQVAKGTCSFIKPQLPKTKNFTAFR